MSRPTGHRQGRVPWFAIPRTGVTHSTRFPGVVCLYGPGTPFSDSVLFCRSCSEMGPLRLCSVVGSPPPRPGSTPVPSRSLSFPVFGRGDVRMCPRHFPDPYLRCPKLRCLPLSPGVYSDLPDLRPKELCLCCRFPCSLTKMSVQPNFSLFERTLVS